MPPLNALHLAWPLTIWLPLTATLRPDLICFALLPECILPRPIFFALLRLAHESDSSEV